MAASRGDSQNWQCFEISTDEHGIAHIVLNRPEKRNAMIRAFWDELPEAIEWLDQSGQCRVIVISSTGPHFTAGIDLAGFAELTGALGAGESDTHRDANRGLDFLGLVHRMQNSFTALEKARVPVIAAIQGGCIGGGVDMASACDMRYCTEDAFFTVYEINIGMTADVGTFPRLLNLLPEGIVRELSYTGRRMGAEEAARYGLVNQVYADHEAMLDAVMETAREIAAKAPMAIHGIKNVITHARDHKTQETLDYVGLWNAAMLKQSEIMTAMMAKQSGQPGDFAPLPPKRKVSGEEA